MSILNFDLKSLKVSAYSYAENSQILLCAFTFDDPPIDIIDLASGEKFLADFEDASINYIKHKTPTSSHKDITFIVVDVFFISYIQSGYENLYYRKD